MAKCFIIFFLLLFLPLLLNAQYNNIKFEHLSVDNGLSNNILYSILQDNRGFMWFGTEDGLNKYDGYDFTVYRHDPEDLLSISDNWVYTLHESDNGGKHVLWIGTKYGGLNRLDLETEQFTHFRNDPDDPQSLSNDWVVSICEDSFGELWIGTNGGINKFDRETIKFIRYQHDPEDSTSLSNNSFCTIYESFLAGTSILWIGTGYGGLNKFNRKTEKFTHYKHDRHNSNSLSHNLIIDLFADTSGILWITTNNGGLNKFNIETEHFTRFQYDPDDSKSISSNMAGTILEDNFQGKKVLWIDSFNGLNKFDLNTKQFTHYKHNPSDPNSLCNNRLTSLYKDKTGSIWIGTFGGGLSKFNPGRQKFAHIRQEMGNLNSLSDKVILSITESKYYGPNIFWIGTQDGGLNKYDRNKGSFIHYRHDPENKNSLSHDFVITLFESNYQGRHELWIGTLGGLDKFDLKTKKFTRYQHVAGDPYSISNNIIRSIYEDKTGTLWIGTRNGGVNRFDWSSGKFLRKRYYIGEVFSIIEDNKGDLWAGTSRGLAHYNSDSQDFTHFLHNPDDPFSLSNNSVFSMYEDKSSRLWIGTRNGLNLYNRETKKFTRYKVKDGLPSNVINGILEDDYGNLWLNTNYGLSKFNPVHKTFRNYNLLDGLQSDQFIIGASCLSQKGEMFFGGVNGFNVFHPDNIRDNPHMPNVYITNFKIFNKTVNIKTGDRASNNDEYYLLKHISSISEITLSYKESVFSLEFAVLDYYSPQKNQYAYKMQGVNPDWVYTDASRRFATYTQLDPGEYIFKVKGSNNDGLWNEEGTSIKVIITPPWWKTNFAYILYVFLFGFIVFGVWRFQINRLKMKHELELEHVHAEKLEEVDRIKSRFFANISHEFRTPLTLIKGPVQQLMSDEFRENIKDKYKMILRNSDRLLQLINQLLDLSKLESGKMKLQASKIDIVPLMKGLVFSFASLAERKKITLKFSGKQKSVIGYIDCDKMEKIISNLMSNAFKFTPECGKIVVALSLREGLQTNRSTKQSPYDGNKEIAASPPASGTRNDNFQFPVSNSDFVEITVTNTGYGIPTDCTVKIFDRFYQADNNYKKDSEGTGIGLALTKELVEVCHGEISVECKIIGENDKTKQPPFPLRRGIKEDVISKKDFKTTFTILLPVSKESFKQDEIIVAAEEDSPLENVADPPHPVKRDLHRGGGARGLSSDVDIEQSISQKNGHPPQSLLDRGGTLRPAHQPARSPLILIVEDNPDVVNYISSFLEKEYRIITAENGQVGWKKTMEKYPDLIISDVMMPEMDGFELCQKIKSDIRTSHIPVILLTAKAGMDNKIDGLQIGADDYINKPFEARELQVRAKNMIEQRNILRAKFTRMIDIKPGEIATTSTDEKFVKRLLDVFEDHVAESDFSTDDFAREVGMSRSNLHRKLQALTNQPTHKFLRILRLKRAAQLLKKSTGSVTEVAYAVGFNNPSYFTKMFRRQFGQTPSEFINKNQ